jgi:hypothetical protein
LVWPVAAAAAVRLGLLAVAVARGGTDVLNGPDTNSYLGPGRSLLLHGSFVKDGLPDIVRTPGYALFLALMSLAGPVSAALAQVVLSLLSVVLVSRLARAVFADDRVALASAWIFAFEPLSVSYSILLYSFSRCFCLAWSGWSRSCAGAVCGCLRRLDCGWRQRPLCARSRTTFRLRWLWDCLWRSRVFQGYAGRRLRCCC